ncbi:MAG: glycosyltransferase [Actinomycetota bacterium]|nr:glycosyltransferase [Actinomycetota bacterium]
MNQPTDGGGGPERHQPTTGGPLLGQPPAGSTSDRCGGVRVLVLSQRGVEHALAYTSWSEGEDVLISHGDADLHLLASASAPVMRAREVVGRNVRRVTSADVLLPPIAARGPRVEGSYDIAVAVLRTVWDLATVEAVPGLRRAASCVAGWFPEAWPPELTDKVALHPFSLLDEIFVGEPRSAERLSALLGRPVHFLPLASDVVVFGDHVTRPATAATDQRRPIDVLNIGRREPDLHAALVRWSRPSEHYYVFDTFTGASVTDRPAHRRALADQLQRTSVAISSYAKQGQAETGGIRWISSRVFDNLASGTILAGAPPEATAQQDLFGREVVHPLPEDPAAAVDVIAELVSSASAAERTRNTCTAMAGHDWSHRWVELLETCQVAPSPALAERAERLRRAAAERRATPAR